MRDPTPTPRRRLQVLVCRGCCCGTERKHPTTDHDRQLADLTAAAGAGATVTTVDCLGRCDRSNVLVVKPARRPAVWIGPVLDEHATAAVGDWLRAGAPLPPPPAVRDLVFDRHGHPTAVPAPARRAGRLAGALATFQTGNDSYS